MSLLRTRPASTAAMIAVWDDAAILAHALAFEAALARAEAQAGVIDAAAAEAVVHACDTLALDPAEFAEEVALAGTLAIPLVARLRALAPEAHRGATSQDLADTVMMVQVREGARLLAADLARVTDAFAHHARATAALPALGRTLLQDAAPIGFGLRIAQWHAGIAAAARALAEAVRRHARLQFGGAVGTRAGLGGQGGAVADALAAALDLPAGPPWHARREGVAALAAALAIVIGTLAKAARDIAFLAQNGIGEAHEPQVAGRGGSSAMAHKRNPTGCQVALSAGLRAPGLAATVLAALPAEAERGLGGWQAEGPVLAELFLLAAGAAAAMAEVAQGLEIDRAAIARNLAAAGLGEDIGESAGLVAALLESVGD